MNRQSKAWVFTYNNYPEDWKEHVRMELIDYMIVGYETAPTTGTPHLQGYVQFGTRKRREAVLRILGSFSIHTEASQGDTYSNKQYCKKGGKFEEWGESKEVDPRKQWAEYIEKCNKCSRKELCQDEKWGKFFTMYPNTYDNIKKWTGEEPSIRAGPSNVNLWYWGATGTGKSRKAHEEHPGAYVKGQNKWWDGYDGQKEVLIDDIAPETARCLTHHIKNWADRYPFPAEYKGGMATIAPVKLIITSNYSPEQIWGDFPADLEAIKRRFQVVHFSEGLGDRYK